MNKSLRFSGLNLDKSRVAKGNFSTIALVFSCCADTSASPPSTSKSFTVREKYYFERSFGKEDLISEIKTERLFLTFRRLLQHYPMGSIKSYPGEVDSFMHLSIPVAKSKDDINGTVFKSTLEMIWIF